LIALEDFIENVDSSSDYLHSERRNDDGKNYLHQKYGSANAQLLT
jgi:hypothetical protein